MSTTIKRETNTKYGMGKSVPLPYDQAVARTRAALQEEGFGVLTEIDVKATLKQKLDVDFKKYVILGACNPPLAWQGFQAEADIGLLLPCNVIVYEAEEAGKSVVAAIDARAMLSVVGGHNETLDSVAVEVNEKLNRVVAQL